MSGLYGSRSIMPGHANLLQKQMNEAFIIGQVVVAVVVSKNNIE